MTPNTEVLIVGGGIVGAACAFELSRRGVGVTVVDRGEMGHGCSYGNAGWVTPCFAMPLPMPGVLKKALRWSLDADSPLYIKLSWNWALISWLSRFLRSMSTAQMHRSVAALSALSKLSLQEYRELDAKQPGAFGFQRRGLLMVAQTPSGLNDARAEMELVQRHGIPGRELDARALREFEPAITGRDVLGGIFFPEEADVEPLAAVQYLLREAQANGAVVMPNTEVFEFTCYRDQIVNVRTTRGTITAGEIVLAAGAWSSRLGRKLGLRVPILSGKGYAIITEPFSPTPSIPCMLIEKKVAVTPRGSTVRLAGTLELVDLDETITARRVRAMINGARQYLNVPAEPRILELWRGLRPCTPDGLPIIGRAGAFKNLILATGHQMLGLQTAPATGYLVADLIMNETPAIDPTPFRSDRF